MNSQCEDFLLEILKLCHCWSSFPIPPFTLAPFATEIPPEKKDVGIQHCCSLMILYKEKGGKCKKRDKSKKVVKVK